MQITITRDHVSVPWGFRLKGGAEYNVPLSILKVNEGSPSHTKLENGDVIVSIGQYPALNLKHEEALNIIRMFDVTLPLTIRRDQQQQQQQQPSYSPMQLPKQNTSSLVWRPTSYIEQPAPAPAPAPMPVPTFGQVAQTYDSYAAYYANNYDAYQHQLQQLHQQNLSQQEQVEQIPSVNVQALVQAQVPVTSSPKSPLYFNNNNNNNNYFNNNNNSNQYRHFNFNNNTNSQQFYNRNSSSTLTPTSPLAMQPPPPPAPPLPPKGFNSPHVYTPSKLTRNEPSTIQPVRTYSLSGGFNLKSPTITSKPINENRSANAHVPDVLVKALNGPPLSVKPFTYTPGGLDLSHIRESSRVKRYDPANVDLQHRVPTPAHQPGSPSFQQLEQHFAAPMQQNLGGQSPLTVNVNTNQDFESFVTPPQIRPNQRPVKTTQIKPAKPGPPAGSPAQFHVTPQEIVRPKKKPEEGRDLANQSYSFRMLNKWIEDSESNTKPLEMLKNDQETYTAQPTVLNVRRTDVLIAVEEEEKKQRKLQLLQKAKHDGNANVPSKVFKFIDRKYSTDIFEYPAINEPVAVEPPSGPPSQRNQELGGHKYRGAEIPSKSFKQLQNMTRAAEAQYHQESKPKAEVVHAEAPKPVQEAAPAPPPAEVVANLQIEVSAETSSQQESEPVAQTVAQEVTNETTVNVNQIDNAQEQSDVPPPTETQPIEPEKPAEQQQIDAQIEAVIETLSQPEPEPQPAPPAEPEPAPEPEPEPIQAEPEPTPAPQPEPEPAPEPQQQPEPEPEPAPVPAPAADPVPEPEPQPSQIEQTVSNDQAQDKNETSDF